MILLSHLRDSRKFIVNAELIKFIEDTPETLITLQNNEKILVKETSEEVVKKAIEYARSIRTLTGIES